MGDGSVGEGLAGEDSTGVPTAPSVSWVVLLMVGVLGVVGLATAEVGRDGGRIVGSLGVIPECGTPVSGQSNMRLWYRV